MFLRAIFDFIRVLFRYTDNSLDLCSNKNIMLMKKVKFKFAMLLMSVVSASCEIVDTDLDKSETNSNENAKIALKSVASVLADIPFEDSHVKEVFEAVTASAENGYDEEYTMKHLF